MSEKTAEQIDAEIAKVGQELEALNAKAEQLTAEESGTGTDLIPVAKTATDARQALAHQRASAIKMRQQLATKAKQMSELQRRKVALMERAMQRELDRMERHLAPLRDQLERLEEAVWTVNLYLGRDEEIVRLYNGKPAPASQPVVVRQLVLAMDQECAVAAEEGGIDSLSHEQFDKWLQEDWAHVEQVIPEEKCVVACVPRYDNKQYADMGTYKRAAEGNAQTYFLIRNGRQVYRTWTDFRIGRALVPKRDEFTSYFMERVPSYEREKGDPEQRAMEPGSKSWLAAEKAAGKKQRDYMRVGLILEGLLHRTTVFHPLPEGGISFTDPQFHENGTVRFVLDAERTLGSGREPFRQWLKRLNAQLRPGMRVVASFEGQGFYEARMESADGGKRRIRGPGHGMPDTGAIYRIENREPDGALVIRFHPEGTRLVEDGETPVPGKPGYVYRYKSQGYKRRRSCLLYPDDDFLIPYDLVTAEECQAYLDSRIERASYVTMFPVLKAVIKAKRAEEALEAPFRTMLTGVLARDCGVSIAQAEEDVLDLVRWYKLSNRIHRPIAINGQALPPGVDWDEVDLVSQDPHAEDAAKPIRLITAEYKLRLRAAERGHSDEMVDALKVKHPNALLIGRLRSGPYLVLTPEDDRNVHVRELHYYARTGELKEEKRWVLPGTRPSRWLVLYQSERWAEWDLAATASEHLTGPELEMLLERIRAREDDKVLAAICTREGHDDDYGWSSKLPGNLFAEAWVIEDYDGAIIGGTKKPTLVARTYRWTRKGRGAPQIAVGQTHGYSDLTFGKPTWTVNDTHGRKRRVFYENMEVVREYRAAAKRHKSASSKAKAKRSRSERIIDAAIESIKIQWLQPRYEKVYQRFLDDYADASLWEGHRKQHRDLLPEFALHHADRHGPMSSTAPAWVRALHALANAGHEPWGMTVDEALQLAHKDPRFTMAYDDWADDLIIWSEKVDGARTGQGHRKPEEVELSAPAEIADLKFVKGLKLVEPWPDPEEEDSDEDLGLPPEFCEECGEYLDECVCAVEGEDFDVEGDAEEGVAALGAGEVVDADVVAE